MSPPPEMQPPWRPSVIAATAAVFGPLAGGLLTSLSLHRVGTPTKARVVAGITAVVSLGLLGFSASLSRHDHGNAIAAYVVCSLLGAVAFPLVLDADYRGWLARNPDSYAAPAWQAGGWAALGALVLCGGGYLAAAQLVAADPSSAADASDAVDTSPAEDPAAQETESFGPGELSFGDALAGEPAADKTGAPPGAERERLSQACETGSAADCYALGLMWGNGQGGPADLAQARGYVKLGCDGGHKEACDFLPVMAEP